VSEAALDARGLRRSLGGRVVVDGVDLVVAPGEIVGLLGPNGAGKTTCFRLIAGLLDLQGGSVRIGGESVDGLPLWRRVRQGLGYLPQGPSVFRRLTVRANLTLALEAADAPSCRADALLERLGLMDRAADRAGTLSGGERRRLEIARCLAVRPQVVLLDEPFAGIDPVAVAGLQSLVCGLAAEDGIAVLVTDHAVHATLPVCDRAVILDGGRVLAQGTPEAVAADPGVRARYLGPNFQLGGPR
jgi:lipopolysaccharide export system ATP-binding protein